MATARFSFDWETQFRLSLDPERAKEYYEESRTSAECGERFCTMCGPKFCAMKTTQELKQLRSEQ
jgi:phosphomethylpyrimidine synthase